MLKFDCCFLTDVGKIRNNNEDNFFLNGNYKRAPWDLSYTKYDLIYRGGLFAVCDGMGGEEYGERASLIAVETLKEYRDMNFNESINKYINEANEKICDLINENNGTRSGTTLALIYIQEGIVYTYNVGDSRIYLFRRGRLKQISKDHTRAEQMVDMGILTKEQAASHRDRHIVTQHLGIFPEELIIEAYKSEQFEVANNDVLLICSDGLTDMVSDEEIQTVMQTNDSANGIANELMNKALNKGGKDNVTVGIIKTISPKEGFFNRLWRKQ